MTSCASCQWERLVSRRSASFVQTVRAVISHVAAANAMVSKPNHIRLNGRIGPATDTTRTRTRSPIDVAARDGSHANFRISPMFVAMPRGLPGR